MFVINKAFAPPAIWSHGLFTPNKKQKKIYVKFKLNRDNDISKHELGHFLSRILFIRYSNNCAL